MTVRTRAWLAASLFCFANCAAAAPPYEQQMATLPNTLPVRVRNFIERRATCNHWAGEDGYDAERRAQIKSAVDQLRCQNLEREEAILKRRYAKKKAVLHALAISRDWSPG